MIEREEICTQREAAKRLGISPQSVGIWAKRPGAPVAMRRGVAHPIWPKFPLWRDAERERQLRDELTSPDLDAARARKLAAEAELAEYQLAITRGEFIAVQDLDGKVGPMLDNFRARLLAIPHRMAPHVVACRNIADARELIEREVRTVLTELSGRSPEESTDDA